MSDNLKVTDSAAALIQEIINACPENPGLRTALVNFVTAAGNPDDEIYSLVSVEHRQMALAVIPTIKRALRGLGLEIE